MFFWVALIFMILFTIFHFWFDFRSFLKTGNSMVESFTGNNSEFIQLIGDNFQKPTKGATLDVSEFKSWDNFVFSLTIRPLGKLSGWTNIMHNTFTGNNNDAGGRWPAIWFISNTTRLHIRIGKAGGSSWNNGINTSYHLPLNKESRVVVDLNNDKLNVKIFDENDKLVFDQTKIIPTARPPFISNRDICDNPPRAPNQGRHKKTGCDGARWSGGSPSKTYCTNKGTSAKLLNFKQKDFYTKCCDWKNNKCLDKSDKHKFYFSDPWARASNVEVKNMK